MTDGAGLLNTAVGIIQAESAVAEDVAPDLLVKGQQTESFTAERQSSAWVDHHGDPEIGGPFPNWLAVATRVLVLVQSHLHQPFRGRYRLGRGCDEPQSTCLATLPAGTNSAMSTMRCKRKADMKTADAPRERQS